jgi:hypothetical protein
MKIGTRVGVFAVFTLTALIVPLLGFVQASTPVLPTAVPLSAPESEAGIGERLTQEAPGVLEVPSGGKPIQDVGDLLRIEVDSLRVLEGGKVIVFLSFINKTNQRLHLHLQKPFAIDEQGNVYPYESSSGFSGAVLPVGGKAPASIIFSPSEKSDRLGWLFSVTFELSTGGDTYSVSFREMRLQNQQQMPYSEGRTSGVPSSLR